ncbi:MAG: hypothetical protein D6763_08435, partial [Alphaproteobacteria bacterium]
MFTVLIKCFAAAMKWSWVSRRGGLFEIAVLALGMSFCAAASAQVVSVSGVVRDALTGQPVNGATVNWGQSGTSEFNTQTTGSDGAYSFNHNAAPELWIEVKHPDYFDSGRITFPAPAGQPIVRDVSLNPLWGVVRGTVRGNMPDGSRPLVVGAGVELYYENQPLDSRPLVLTDSNGGFEFPRVRDSDGFNPRKLFGVIVKNHADYFPTNIFGFEVEGGRTNQLEILVDPAWGVVRGRVTRMTNNMALPVANAKVELWWPELVGPDNKPTTFTDANGDYTFPRVLDSRWDVLVSGKQTARTYWLDVTHSDFFPDRGIPIGFVHGGQTNTADITMKAAFGSIAGTVTGLIPGEGSGPRIKPLSNLTVTVEAGSFSRTTQTDANGQYRFDRLLATDWPDHQPNPNRFYTVKTAGTAPFIGQERNGLFVVGGEEKRIELRLELNLAKLSGVVDSAADGSPIRGARIRVIPQGELTDYSGPKDTVTDDMGLYDLELPKNGTYTVIAEAFGFESKTNTLALTFPANIQNFRLTPKKAVIYYRVVDGFSRAAVSNATVELRMVSSGSNALKRQQNALAKGGQPPANTAGNVPPFMTSQSDANGAGQFEPIDPGHYELTASAPGYDPLVKNTEAVQTSTVLPVLLPLVRAGQGARVSGTVLDDVTGLPIPDAEVWTEAAKTVTDLNGSFEFPKLAPGFYRINVFAPGYHTGTSGVLLKFETVEETVTIRLQPLPVDPITVTPNPLDFGTFSPAEIAFQGLAPVVARLIVRVVNPNTFPMRLTGFGIRGADASQFRIVRARVAGGSWSAIGKAAVNPNLELPAKGVVEVEIGFAPSRPPVSATYLGRFEVIARGPGDSSSFANSTLLARLGDVRPRLDVIDANLGATVDDNTGALYRRGTSQPMSEPDIAALNDPTLDRIGYVADGHARLILRYQINRNIGGFVRFTIAPLPGAGMGTQAKDWGTLGTLTG